MKNQISNKDKLTEKLESDEKELEWLDDNQTEEKEEYEEKFKEAEAICNPIIR